MDKNTLSNYGWIVIAVLVLAVMIALATPFGEYIKAGVESTTAGLFETSEKAMNVVGMSATNPPANKFDANTITKNYYINAQGIGKTVANYNMTDYIYVYGHETLLFGGDGHQLRDGARIGAFCLYDANKNFISREAESYTGYKIPDGVHYIRVQYLNGDKIIMADGNYHSFNQINLDVWSEYDVFNSNKNYNLGTLVTFGDSHVGRGIWQPDVIEYFTVKEHINLGIGSSTVAINNSATQLPFVSEERINEIKTASPDTIIIIGGTNDVHLDTPLGTVAELSKSISEKDITTYYGAYSYLIETLLEWKPTLNVFICTIPQGIYDASHTVKYSDISNAVESIGDYYSLPVVDIYNDCGIDTSNLDEFSDDKIHYNAEGNKKVSDLMIAIITEELFR